MILGPGHQTVHSGRVETLITSVLTCQVRGRETPLQVGDVPLEVDQGLALLRQTGVQALAGAAVPDHEVEDGLNQQRVSQRQSMTLNSR